jgi:predicted  nucleic acid-binding Zn-ribbon protein
MSGLYHRALEIYRQTIGLRLVGRGEEGLDIEDISPEDRQKILRQINEVIDRNRIKVDSDTFVIPAKRSGIGLPILINGSIAAVVIAALLTFSLLFNRQEDVLAAGSGAILSTESKLIETLRKESQAQLQEKDREIRAFQEQLQETVAEQQRLREETERTLREREQQLEERLQRAVAEERQRLLDQGLSEAAIAERLRTFEAEKRAELEAEFETFRRQTEDAVAAREATLAGLVRDYEQSLQAAQADRSDLERRLEQREAEMQQQFEARSQALESDRARVAEQLSLLQEQQRQEQLVRDQILGAYEGVNESIALGEYSLALQKLESIRLYLDQEPARSLAGIQRRRAVELFIISSLEDLIRSRSAQESRDPQSLIDAGGRIEALSQGVRRADQLLQQGDIEAARQQYLSALEEISAARTGYDQLSLIEARRLAQEKARADRQVASRLSQGRSLFADKQYEQSLERYREALTLLLQDPAAAGRIVEQIGEISARLAPAVTAAQAATVQAEPEVSPATTTQPDVQLLAELQKSRERIAELEQENSLLTERLNALESREQTLEQENARLSEQLERLESQQQMLEGDQAAVAAQIERLEEEKASLSAAAERLQEEKAGLAAAVEQLRSEKQSLSAQLARAQAQYEALRSERDGLLARTDALERERDRLAEAERRARELEAAREDLRQRLTTLESRYQRERRSADLNAATPPETLADLLEAKLLTWQIIASDPVASQYPQLYDTMDRYLETLSEQSLLEGRYAAVGDMITVIDALLNGSGEPQVPTDLWRRYSYGDQEDLLARLLEKLERVLK